MIRFVYADGYRFPVSEDKQAGLLKAHLGGVNGWGYVTAKQRFNDKADYELLLSRVRKALSSKRMPFETDLGR